MKFLSVFLKYFDGIDDLVSSVMGIVSIVTGATIISMLSFLSENVLIYALLGFFGFIGQTSMYFAKIRFPDLFGKHDEKKTLGTKVLHYIIDCLLAALFAALCSEYLIDFIFTTLSFIQNTVPVESGPEYKRLIIGAIIVGAFYETILKKLLKKNKQIQKEDEN